MPGVVERRSAANHEHAPAEFTAKPREHFLLGRSELRGTKIRKNNDPIRSQFLERIGKTVQQFPGGLDILAKNRLFRRTRQAGELDRGIGAQRKTDEFVIPGQRPLNVKDTQFFLVGNANGRICQDIDTLQIRQIGWQQLHLVRVRAGLLLADDEVLDPRARAVARRNAFLLMKLAVAK